VALASPSGGCCPWSTAGSSSPAAPCTGVDVITGLRGGRHGSEHRRLDFTCSASSPAGGGTNDLLTWAPVSPAGWRSCLPWFVMRRPARVGRSPPHRARRGGFDGRHASSSTHASPDARCVWATLPTPSASPRANVAVFEERAPRPPFGTLTRSAGARLPAGDILGDRRPARLAGTR